MSVLKDVIIRVLRDGIVWYRVLKLGWQLSIQWGKSGSHSGRINDAMYCREYHPSPWNKWLDLYYSTLLHYTMYFNQKHCSSLLDFLKGENLAFIWALCLLRFARLCLKSGKKRLYLIFIKFSLIRSILDTMITVIEIKKSPKMVPGMETFFFSYLIYHRNASVKIKLQN